MNALASDPVADFVNEHCVATYLKVGTFRIVNGQKQGGNVASYFCLPDGSVLHAVAGPVDARKFLSEARWAVETRKSALTLSTKLTTGEIDPQKYRNHVQQAHRERFRVEAPQGAPRSRPGQVHALLMTNPLMSIDEAYPIVWEQVLNEKLSGLPVAQR